MSDGVLFKERGLLSSNETKIPFEHIADELVRTFHVSRLYLFISLLFALAFGYRLVRFMSTDEVLPLYLDEIQRAKAAYLRAEPDTDKHWSHGQKS